VNRLAVYARWSRPLPCRLLALWQVAERAGPGEKQVAERAGPGEKHAP
jgi:hypothetical protein